MTRMLLGIAVFALAAGSAVAHHSFAMYNMAETRRYTGRLTRFVPGANHAQLHFEVLDEQGQVVVKDGKPVLMGVETASAAQMANRGVTVDAFPQGTIITVVLHPLRDGRPFGALAGELIKCGTTFPPGGCTKATGQVFDTGNAQ